MLLLVLPLLNRRYSAKWRYFVWLILTVRLVIPFDIKLPQPLVNIPVKNPAAALRPEGVPAAVVGNGYAEQGSISSSVSAPVVSLWELLTVIWAAGAICFFMYHIISYFVFKHKIKPHCGTVNSDILKNVLDDMSIKNMPPILSCGKIASPMMTGLFRPAILLPHTEYEGGELSVILKHELTHYRRGDLWYKLLLVIANSIHWFNPFVYLMVRQANRDLECSCDDAVIKNSDINYRKEYSLAILNAMHHGGGTPLSAYLNGGGGNE